jgi:hypothetical protein
MAINKLRNANVHEILTRAGEAATRVEKIEVLREYNSLALRDVLKGAYDDTIQFIIPKGVPPYTPSRPESIPSNLRKQSGKFRFFVKGGPGEQLAKVKVEQMFVKILEVIHPDDAVVIIKMKDKELEGVYKGITKKLVTEAFPGLIRV